MYGVLTGRNDQEDRSTSHGGIGRHRSPKDRWEPSSEGSGTRLRGCVSEIATHPCKQIGQGVAARKRDPDLARGDGDARSDLEQLEPDGVALSLGQIGVFES